MRGATRALSLAYDNALRPSGLRMTQYSILTRVTALGRPLLSELAEMMTMDRTTLGRNLRPLERDGLVKLDVGHDRRERLVSVTAAGIEMLELARPLWKAMHQRLETKFGTEEAQQLRAALRLITRAGRELALEDSA